jgi:hypothetical protein
MPLILGTNSIKDTGYNVDNSLRFNSGSSDYLTKSNGSGSTTKATISVWVKHTFGSSEDIFQSFNNAENAFRIRFRDTGEIELQADISNSTILYKKTNALFRDSFAWMHICVIINLSDGTAEDKVQLYVNGLRVTSFATNTTTSATSGAWVGGSSDFDFTIGRNPGNSNYYNGYMSEFVFIDNNNLAADQFGEFDEDSGIWKPIDVSGLTFGTNGFYLEFKESGTSQNSSGLGADTSGQDNHFAVNNLTAVDQSTDTCTNNFATGNPIAAQGGSAQSNSLLTFSEGNLLMAANSETGIANFGLSKGKWFWEVKVITDQDGLIIGACNEHFNINAELGYNSPASASGAKAFGYYGGNGTATVTVDDGSGFSSYGSAIAVNNIVSVALDLDSADQSCTFYLNGSSQGALDITNLSSGESYFPAVGNWSVADVSTSWNFGSPQYSESGGNSDGNGYGNFSMAVPSGYYALNTKNLAEYG